LGPKLCEFRCWAAAGGKGAHKNPLNLGSCAGSLSTVPLGKVANYSGIKHGTHAFQFSFGVGEVSKNENGFWPSFFFLTVQVVISIHTSCIILMPFFSKIANPHHLKKNGPSSEK